MIAVLGAALVCAQSVVAQEPEATLDLDLNAVKQVDTSCQLTFVGRNGMAADITGIAAETVLFDTEGRVAVMTMLDFGELPSNRSRVRQFALANTSCDSIGQVLFNGVQTCDGAGLSPSACADALAVTSRTDIEVLQ